MGDEILYFYNTLLNWDTTALLAVNGYHSEFWDDFMWMYSSKWTWLPLYASLAYVMFRSIFPESKPVVRIVHHLGHHM